MKLNRIIKFVVAVLVLIVLIFVSRAVFHGAMTIHELLTENKKLKQSLTNLTHEDQIGYAKVLKQEMREGTLYTTLRFIETDRSNPLKKILEKDYTIEGDIVHFDALIVKVDPRLVLDGRARSMFLWRRIYGETMQPDEGFPIEEIGKTPKRYADLLDLLPDEQQQLFWTHIWDLANDLDKLEQYGISAIYGNVIYTKLVPGVIYVFRINASGQVYAQVVLDM